MHITEIEDTTLSGLFSSSRIEISKSALQSNLSFLRKVIGKNVIICSVVKGNAYGHGMEQFVPLAETCGVRWFAVYSADEALRVFNSSTAGSSIMIMGGMSRDQVEWAIEHGITFYVFDLNELTFAIESARKVGKRAQVHLEIETGMNRLGFGETALEQAAELIKYNNELVDVVGVCTHFAGAESVANHLRIQHQIQTFETRLEWLFGLGIEPRLRHAASSAATFSYPYTRYDMVRVGIAQYGFWPSIETRMQYVLQQQANGGKQLARDPLTRVLRWKSHVINVKDVRAGEFIGYGTSFLTTRPSRVAAVPVGYYHGFNRNLSNVGHVLVRGKRVPVAGVVNMNLMLVDVTDVRHVENGDEVVLIGKQGRSEITVGAFSDLTKLLNYEALVRLSPDIARTVVP